MDIIKQKRATNTEIKNEINSERNTYRRNGNNNNNE